MVSDSFWLQHGALLALNDVECPHDFFSPGCGTFQVIQAPAFFRSRPKENDEVQPAASGGKAKRKLKEPEQSALPPESDEAARW